MRVLVTGADGQLGRELARTLPEGATAWFLRRQDLDLTEEGAASRALAAWKPQWVVNTAAYTAVDQAESEPEAAYAVNRDGVVALARAAREQGVGLVHLSTDFVFSGRQGRPYRPEDAVAPLGVYGTSKADGEAAVREMMSPDRWLIVRTSWLYASHGRNFVKTMLRLMQEREQVRVVADQIGSPTWARGLAAALWLALARGVVGDHHWTDAGVASWYDFAVAIQEEAAALGVLNRMASVTPIATADYPTPASRPGYSVLDKSTTWEALGMTSGHWRVALRGMLRELMNG